MKSDKIFLMLYNPNVFNGAGAMSRILSIKNNLKRNYKLKFIILLSPNRFFKFILNSDFRNKYFENFSRKDCYILPILHPLHKLILIDLMLIKFYNAFIRLKNEIIQCETEVPSYLSASFKDSNNLIIYDKHGLSFEESKLKLDLNIKNEAKKLNMAECIEKNAISNADIIICVSTVFKRILREKFHFDKKIIVLPMLIDPNFFLFDTAKRKLIRNELKFNGKLVLVYSGSITKYQKFKSMVSFFKRFKAVHLNSKFLILTQPQFNYKIIKYLNELEINSDDFIIKNLNFDQVSDYLSASDMGLLFRDDILLNNVSSPTKLLEYLSSGVYPIITPNIGDSNQLLTSFSYGITIENLDSEFTISEVINDYNSKEHLRELISLRVRQKYNWETYLKSIGEIYAK